MIYYLASVFEFMRKYPFGKGDNFFIWIRNCFYVNWQMPWYWNIDIYRFFKWIRRK